MTITINLDQIILEEIDIPPSQRPRLRVVVEEELSRLLQEKGIPRQLYQGTTIACLSATVKVTKGRKTEQMGKEIAQSIYSYLAGSPCKM
ncbi:hypothetical protein [Crocosphaera sp.]|uniref:hypothetical protein n=1 Tax=Crocosphaera sp. TaxID=2729996 RepID=UPI00260F5132|nr:hypothetical protein [Crocosphaera sp.]MDJ0582126.1 hypothetical protein [Crocosphaera sp.]